MSTTLTNGLKLPDKGSVDWYADMQNNYNILDGAVGTIAEHSTQIAGKAPLVHTHSKAEVTDFPVYGTTAGTICEGNDSRLSDARTPVAHTHLTADVTDLLNTAHEWTKAQTYSDVNAIITKNNDVEIGNEPSAYNEQRFIFRDKNNQQIAAIKYQNQLSSKNVFNNSLEFSATDKFKDGVRDATGTAITTILRIGLWNDGTKYIYNEGRWRSNLLPFGNNTNDVGSSSYQWNNFYAKNYYYNGTAWGLDKANVWSANNQFAKVNTIETNTVEWHNSHYRGINLISTGHFANMAALLTAIRNQDWSDIYIGDYVELTFTYEGASRTVKFYVGEIDKFYKVGNPSFETHHLVIVTGDIGINQVMNDSNTAAGGYVGSKAHTVTLPALYAILNPLFNNAILTHREFLSNNVLSAQTVSLSLDDGNGAVTYSCGNFPLYSSGDPDTPGCVTLGDWYDCNLVLMSEIEMYGSNRFSCSGFDDAMCPDGQIAAFKYNRNLQTLNRAISTWLRNVNSVSRFCYCHNHGRAYRGGAAGTYFRLRPRFLIG